MHTRHVSWNVRWPSCFRWEESGLATDRSGHQCGAELYCRHLPKKCAFYLQRKQAGRRARSICYWAKPSTPSVSESHMNAGRDATLRSTRRNVEIVFPLSMVPTWPACAAFRWRTVASTCGRLRTLADAATHLANTCPKAHTVKRRHTWLSSRIAKATKATDNRFFSRRAASLAPQDAATKPIREVEG